MINGTLPALCALNHRSVHQVPVPEGLTALDLDTIRLTAQFVARHGKGFLTGKLQLGTHAYKGLIRCFLQIRHLC
jgi:hypothetical protein